MAQATPTDTPTAFIAQLLAPISAPAGSARRYFRELRDELDEAWSLARHRYYAAVAYREHCDHLRRIAEIKARRFDVPEKAAAARAQIALEEEIDRMMHVPAPTIGALRLKQELRHVSGGRRRWEAAIAADEARLTTKCDL